ncbi:MAG: hypothetical protein ACKVOR_13140 [Flavobacteriales bacterium]
MKNTLIYLMLIAGIVGLYRMDDAVRKQKIESSATFVYQQF